MPISMLSKLIPPTITRLGASMGRPNVGVRPSTVRLYDCAVPMSRGYDKGGAYWGHGEQLRVEYTKDLSYIYFYRRGSYCPVINP